MHLLGYSIATDYPNLPPRHKIIINTINPHSYCEAKKDKYFFQALKSSDVLLPDGVGIVWAAKFLKGKRIQKIAGADIHQRLLEIANANQQKIFYLGAAQNTLNLIAARIKKEYPNIKVASFSPPYKPAFSQEDSEKMISSVNNFQPDILFVGMTAPKQEKWVHAHKDSLDVNVITSIGAVFDFYAGTVKRSHPIWIKLGLEWLPRLLQEPKRLWRRNFISTPLFIKSVLHAKLKN
ncbi:N-acetylglucosaminyldiphosphoundecaprenol N-acetyl-beta-D-mannosaminyltransferase [Arenibacter nanhaiticus]|uniref:N-acetylglucosaminyldiphosphoundecaprenol N-acetyl-beta-D-mannosaminyltransferase n=1 Tax=Arenibacter nanhaiticus TaxID=558155 RepID=A0A1M6LZ41_9FLAO|nr:WecB/TagA/CpsF family glycosyltransferase [Arenibacter nanhaiticus]SHJ76514.1 N-acetylglucosaminyldiphosphoundecaprenol N-acetyl-beta-D-mannosaminyltransferase [Arenibacter nanhaiticus]